MIPQRIWLQVYDEDGQSLFDAADWDSGVTWCSDQIHDTDVEYVRADSLPQPPEPDWSQAPEWAQWFAVDAGGDCHWYEREPTTVGSGWMNWHRAQGVNGMDDYHLPIGIDWRTTLAKRPEVTS